MVVAPATGANMALGTLAGVHGLDLNTLVASRPLPFVDVTMATGTNFFFNGGAGKDVFTADPDGWTTPPTGWDTAAHLSGVVGLASTLAVTASGGANDDTLAGGAGVNTLLGGAGNDTFLQSKNAAAESISGGDGIDTVDYGVRAAPVYASVGANAGVATVSVAAAGTTYLVGDVLTIAGSKVNPATVTVQTIGALGIITAVTVTTGGSGYAASVGNATTTNSVAGSGATITVATLKGDDGAVGEFDDVQADVEIVKGGAGSDVLSAYPIVTTDVVLIGNAGNDKLTGGAGNDDLCGGAGDDTFYDNAGNDNIVGGIGLDTIDYSAAPNPVFACLNVADTVAGKTCATQNGGKIGDKDLVNATLAKVCPRATLNVGLAAGGTAVVAVPAASQGAAMAVDVENLTGHATAVNTLACGTLACTLFGGSGDDFLYGGAAQDLIFGMGGADHVTSGGANDVIDLTHGGGAKVQTVDCGSNQVTLLISAADVAGKVLTACTAANMP
jgi:Ca2+-binding RTX toxin-like protein